MSQRHQRTARVNVDDATWQAFRIRAIQADRSIADELGRLVRNHLRHDEPIEPSAPRAPQQLARNTPGSATPAPPNSATTRNPRGHPKQRIADLDLLTELPYRPQPPSRAEGAADGTSPS